MALGSCTNLVMAEKLNRMMKEGFGVGMDDCQLTVARREKDHPTSLAMAVIYVPPRALKKTKLLRLK